MAPLLKPAKSKKKLKGTPVKKETPAPPQDIPDNVEDDMGHAVEDVGTAMGSTVELAPLSVANAEILVDVIAARDAETAAALVASTMPDVGVAPHVSARVPASRHTSSMRGPTLDSTLPPSFPKLGVEAGQQVATPSPHLC